MRVKNTIALSLLLAGVLAGCSTGPEPIEYGVVKCDHCQMLIMDAKFGSELVTTRGKAYKFDAVECLAEYLLTGPIKAENIHSLWVSNFEPPHGFMNAKTAFYLKSEKIKSPMGLGLSAYSSEARADEFRRQYGGEVLTYEHMLDYVRSSRNIK